VKIVASPRRARWKLPVSRYAANQRFPERFACIDGILMRIFSAAMVPANDTPVTLADTAYARLKEDIFDFRLVAGDRFSETTVADRLGMSRTPVREALARLQREGYLEVHLRSGWSVKPFDFEQFEHLYDLRMVLETTAVRRLCDSVREADDGAADPFTILKNFWLVPDAARLTDGKRVADMDEDFHIALVAAAGNPEMARVHREVTERIRIIRRLDFTQPARIQNTYDEHAQILRAVMGRRADQATMLLRTHIEASKAEVRKITVHRLYTARKSHDADGRP
jgi:DNA-binding GntR family transcriptional regulator